MIGSSMVLREVQWCELCLRRTMKGCVPARVDPRLRPGETLLRIGQQDTLALLVVERILTA